MYQIQGGQASGYSISPAILLKLTTPNAKHVMVGIKLADIVNQQSWGTGTVERVPPKLRIGLAYQSPNPGLFAVDISQTISTGYAPEISAGYEWNESGMCLRTGYAEGGFTAGAGFAIQHARVDYAYVTQHALSRDNVHRISLSGVW
jgi:hypothetical protein